MRALWVACLIATPALATPSVPASVILSGDATGMASANVVAVQRPAYVAMPVANASTITLPAGYAIYDLTGSGLVATATIKLPPNPQDKQTARVAVVGTVTITAMTVDDANGNLVASGLGMGLLGDALYQYQGVAWVPIGH